MAGPGRWKRARWAAVAILGMLAGAGRADGWPEAWSRPAQPFRIAEGLYYVGTEGIGAYLLTGPQGHVLIDGGLPENAPIVAQNIRTLGFRPADVRLLLNSHAHVDHAGALAELKRLTGARLAASAADRPALERGAVDYGATKDWPFPPVKVDQVVADGESLNVGRVRLTAHLTPGHTKGCTTWTTHLVDHGKPRDVLFSCSATVAGGRLLDDPGYPGIVRDFRFSFARLKRMRADIFLAPHAEIFDMAARRRRLLAGDLNAFVDPKAFPAFVRKSEADFDRELKRQTEAAASIPCARSSKCPK